MFTADLTSRLAAAAIGLALAGPAVAALPCDADLNDDGAVSTADFLNLLTLWGTDPGGPPDFNGDGSVSTADLLDLLSAWGPLAFDYGAPPASAEAQQIGLEMLGASGPLLVPTPVYSRIVHDLAAIRQTVPALSGQTHSPAWLANDMIVNLVPAAPQGDYLCLNERYQVSQINHLFGDWWVLVFPGNLNIPALGAIYQGTAAVQTAEPDSLIGGQNTWSPADLGGGVWRWTIDDGFCDCFDGCDCHVLYVIETGTGGNVDVISVQEVGPSYCDFGAGSC